MRGGYRRKLTARPGHCGACVHFIRLRRSDGAQLATGTCRMKPDIWLVRQSTPRCRTYYREEESGEGMQMVP